MRLSRLHPLGWVVLGFLALSVAATLADSDRLVGNLSWWHWVGLVALLALSAVPTALHRFRLGLESVTSFTGGTPDRPTTWLTASSEVVELLGSGPWSDLSCDPEASLLVAATD